ncbi:hypothetical protein Cni_G22769 [Canna indica]|uniref:Uncharacterized protein n=1 Tax=Canna indica TaxID=4628 RepID=A0AAQ3KSE4_9LILI|nr:hypothetical protein Cni_G22769 [Canna indica]
MGKHGDGLPDPHLPAAQPGRFVTERAIRVQIVVQNFYGSPLLEVPRLPRPPLHAMERIHQQVQGAILPLPVLLLRLLEARRRSEPRVRPPPPVPSLRSTSPRGLDLRF